MDFLELAEKRRNCPKPMYSPVPCKEFCEETCWELYNKLAEERLSKMLREVWFGNVVDGIG